MIKLIKNEFIKLFFQRKMYFLLLTILSVSILGAIAYGDLRMDIINNTVKGQRIVGENRELILNIDFLNFTKLISKDFLFKPFLPIYLIFLSIIVTSIFSDDLLSGNLKFSLISRVSIKKLLISKVIFTLILVTLIASINFIMNLAIGFIVFGGTDREALEITHTLGIYLLSIPPAGAFSIIVLFISTLFKNSTFTMIFSMLLSISINILDLLTNTKLFSPIGIIAILGNDSIGNIAIAPIFAALAYMIIFTLLFIINTVKTDIVY